MATIRLCRKEMVVSKAESLYSRAIQVGREIGIGNHLKVTFGVEQFRKGDTFQTLYSRADLALRYGKSEVWHGQAFRWNSSLFH